MTTEHDIQVVTKTTVRKDFILTETQVEEILQAYGAKILGMEEKDVQVDFDVSSQGFLRTVTVYGESTLEEKA